MNELIHFNDYGRKYPVLNRYPWLLSIIQNNKDLQDSPNDPYLILAGNIAARSNFEQDGSIIPELIVAYHRRSMLDLRIGDETMLHNPGELRTVYATHGKYVTPLPGSTADLLQTACHGINQKLELIIQTGRADEFMYTFPAYVYSLVSAIQPFGIANKRLARVVMDKVQYDLMRSTGLTPEETGLDSSYSQIRNANEIITRQPSSKALRQLLLGIFSPKPEQLFNPKDIQDRRIHTHLDALECLPKQEKGRFFKILDENIISAAGCDLEMLTQFPWDQYAPALCNMGYWIDRLGRDIGTKYDDHTILHPWAVACQLNYNIDFPLLIPQAEVVPDRCNINDDSTIVESTLIFAPLERVRFSLLDTSI